jgi:hypothetical protein
MIFMFIIRQFYEWAFNFLYFPLSSLALKRNHKVRIPYYGIAALLMYDGLNKNCGKAIDYTGSRDRMSSL